MNQLTQDLQSSLIFVAYLLGSLFSGYYGDRIGRKKPCFITCFLVTVLQFLSALAFDTITLILSRTAAAFFIGFFGPLAATILAEITPTHVRGRYMAILTMALLYGQILGAGLAVIFLNHGEKWRILTASIMIPSFISLLLQGLFLDESPRFELLIGNQANGLQIIDKMA